MQGSLYGKVALAAGALYEALLRVGEGDFVLPRRQKDTKFFDRACPPWESLGLSEISLP